MNQGRANQYITCSKPRLRRKQTKI